MRAWARSVAIHARAEIAIGVDGGGFNAIHGKLELAAAGLLEIMQLELLAFHRKRDRLTGRVRREADSAQSVDAVAFARHDAVGVPAGGVRSAGIEPAIPEKRTPWKREPRAPGAELALEVLTHL